MRRVSLLLLSALLLAACAKKPEDELPPPPPPGAPGPEMAMPTPPEPEPVAEGTDLEALGIKIMLPEGWTEQAVPAGMDVEPGAGMVATAFGPGEGLPLLVLMAMPDELVDLTAEQGLDKFFTDVTTSASEDGKATVGEATEWTGTGVSEGKYATVEGELGDTNFPDATHGAIGVVLSEHNTLYLCMAVAANAEDRDAAMEAASSIEFYAKPKAPEGEMTEGGEEAAPAEGAAGGEEAAPAEGE